MHIVQKYAKFCTPFSSICILCAKNKNQMICSDCVNNLPFNVYPCPVCAEAMPVLTEVSCGRCHKIERYYDKIIAPYLYQEPIDKALMKLKYARSITELGLVEFLISTIAENVPRIPNILIPMPMHRNRLRQRGFNQAHEVAKIFAKTGEFKVVWDKCHRKIVRKSQFECNLAARQRNVKASDFVISPLFRAKSVTIVDDVVTTATSVNEFAKALKKHGVEQVYVWALCRTVRS
jgi:ComF family protein